MPIIIFILLISVLVTVVTVPVTAVTEPEPVTAVTEPVVPVVPVTAVTVPVTAGFDCSYEIISIIDIVKKLQPKCDRYDITCIQQNERDIANLTGEMNFKCLMFKLSMSYEQIINIESKN